MVSKQLYKKAQAAAVYEFILKNANVEYYVDDTPAEITVQPEGRHILVFSFFPFCVCVLCASLCSWSKIC